MDSYTSLPATIPPADVNLQQDVRCGHPSFEVTVSRGGVTLSHDSLVAALRLANPGPDERRMMVGVVQSSRSVHMPVQHRKPLSMPILPRVLGVTLALLLGSEFCHANAYDETIELFKHAGESAVFFNDCYAFAVFPTIGAGGLIIGGARGVGQVYLHDRPVGESVMTQVSIGFQAGGKVYSEIVFFQDKHDLDEFESGKFEFLAGASAVAITTGASASVGTDRASSEASGGKGNATTDGNYQTGMAVFTVAKGGLMFAADIAGEKFAYREKSEK